MPPRKRAAKVAEAPVTVRKKAPEWAEDADEEALLYRPVPQLDALPTFKLKYEWFSPEKADKWLRASEADADFRQRPISLAQVRRWESLYKTKRFVNFLPAGPICLDETGVMLNGKHRFTALAGRDVDEDFGFVVFYDVPRWMFAYFDTNKPRTIKDVFHIGARSTGPQTPSAMKLAMRYEEFLAGVRPGPGWRHWSQQRDEHQDVDGFLARRGELQDWYSVGEKINRHARLLVPSVMVFRFYQSLAWSEGDEQITDFCESLVTGANLSPQSPALQLREWARESWYNKDKIFAKRELHLLLLMRAFEQHMLGSRVPRLNWAYGLPMTMPYHPRGHETGLANVKRALGELDNA